MGEWASLRRGRENAEQVSFFTVVPEVSSASEGVSGMPALRARGTPAEVLGVQGLAGSHPGWLARSILAKAHRPGTHSQPPRWPGFAGPQPPPSSGLRKLSCPTGAAAVHEESGPWPPRRRLPPRRRRPGPEIAEIVASLVGHLARGSPSFRGSLVIEYPSPRDCS